MHTLRTLSCALLLVPAAAFAQSSGGAAPQPGATPQGAAGPGDAARDLEPAVDTSRAAGPAANAPAAGPGGDLQPAADTSAAAVADSARPAPASAPKRRPAATRAARPEQADRVDLGTTDITGNKELPTVTYIVPWRRSDLTDLTGKPVNSLVDETLEPVDRTVFNRRNRYYDALARKVAPQGGSQGQASRDER
ncbi:MAG TPA: hypothetical protein VMB48_02970 [Steroidobacteraceae bacterium]|nr:hypothetical protein [Steroidobacteraceae bacterium]